MTKDCIIDLRSYSTDKTQPNRNGPKPDLRLAFGAWSRSAKAKAIADPERTPNGCKANPERILRELKANLGSTFGVRSGVKLGTVSIVPGLSVV